MPDFVLRDDITIQQGDDRPLTWTLADSNGDAVDVTGYGAVAQVRAYPDAPTVLHEWSTADGTAVFAESTVSLKTDQSETWTWAKGDYDLHVTDPSGQTEVVARGSIRLTRAVTR